MSSFLVTDSCICKIIAGLNTKPSDFRWALREANRSWEFWLETEEGRQEMAEQLLQLNCDALDARYGEGTGAHDAAGLPPILFVFPSVAPTPVEVLKAIACWSYQCAEGDVPEHPLFKAMQEIRLQLAESIVKTQCYQEFNKASWGE